MTVPLGTPQNRVILYVLLALLGGAALGANAVTNSTPDAAEPTTTVVKSTNAPAIGVDDARAFLSTYYSAVVNAETRTTAWNHMLTDSFRKTNSKSTFDSWWPQQQVAVVKDVVPSDSFNTFNATVTYVAKDGSITGPEATQYKLTCSEGGTTCSPDEMQIDSTHVV